MTQDDQFIYEGFEKPASNYFRLPRDWTDITSKITSLAELKIVEYVLKHTWGYHEYGQVKKITIDEFMHGRKYKTGERVDKGTGLTKQSVIDGIKKAIAHGLLLEEIDSSDKARIKKSYALKMKDAADHDKDPIEGENNEANRADVKNLDIGVKNLDSKGQEFRHRSEKDTIDKYTLKNVSKSNGKNKDETEYFAQLIAKKLNDEKSISYYKLACQRFDPNILLEKAHEIMADGGAKKPGAVFTAWVNKELNKAQPSLWETE
jgi:hypothetical protein